MRIKEVLRSETEQNFGEARAECRTFYPVLGVVRALARKRSVPTSEARRVAKRRTP